ncbi:protein S100-A5 isoform X1 [Pteropus alecto]|nr:protein S100-A5 isoform X1 [Pteropus alecto]
MPGSSSQNGPGDVHRATPLAVPWPVTVEPVMETPLEKALTTMVTTFHKYSGREGSKLTLSRKELKELIKKELCLGEKMQESSIDDLMKSLDKNSDQEIDFKEYSVFLTTLCMAYNDFFLEEHK